MNSEATPDGPIGIEDLRNLVGELRLLARQLLHCESAGHSLTPTALAMTALRRVRRVEQDWDSVRWENRRHFFGALSQAMKRALVDHARRRHARGRSSIVYRPGQDDLLNDLAGSADEQPEAFLRVQEAIERLRSESPDFAEILEEHYYGGYTTAEIARFRECSEKTVDRNLARARVLFRQAFESCPSA